MPHWVLMILFCAIIGALAVIVRWELGRMFHPPGWRPGNLKQFFSSEASDRLGRAGTKTGHGLDW